MVYSVLSINESVLCSKSCIRVVFDVEFSNVVFCSWQKFAKCWFTMFLPSCLYVIYSIYNVEVYFYIVYITYNLLLICFYKGIYIYITCIRPNKSDRAQFCDIQSVAFYYVI